MLAGLPVAHRVFEMLDDSLKLDLLAKDGQPMQAGDKLLRIEGRATSILTGERTALNFLSHLSGIATRAAHMKDSLGRGTRPGADSRYSQDDSRLSGAGQVCVSHGRYPESPYGTCSTEC